MKIRNGLWAITVVAAFCAGIVSAFFLLLHQLDSAMAGQKEKALKASRTYATFKPDSVPALIGLADNYLSVGDKKAALEQYKIIKELDSAAAESLLIRINK